MKRRFAGTAALLAGLILCAAALAALFQNRAVDSPQSVTTLRVAIAADVSTKYDQLLFDAFMEEHPDIKIETITFLPPVYSQNLEALMSGQQPADVIFIKELSQLGNLVSKGILKPLDFFLSQSEISPEALIGYEGLKSGEDLAHYALPYRAEKYFLYYNKDLFDWANIPYPARDLTWREFLETGSAMNKRLRELGMDGKRAALFLPDGNSLLRMTVPDLPSMTAGDLRQLSRSLEMMEQLAREGMAVPFHQCYAQNFQQEIFETGDYAMFITSSSYLPALRQKQAEGTLNFNWGAVSQPFWPEEKSGNNLKLIVPVCIYRYTEQPDTAWKFISFLCGERGAALTARNLLFPAYNSESARQALAASAKENRIEAALLGGTYQAPLAACPATDEIDMFSFISDEYMSVLMGLITREQCVHNIAARQDHPA